MRPAATVPTGPAQGEALLAADLDLNDIPRSNFELDLAGHYNRPDLFAFYAKV
jgi:nitrilase